MTAITQTLADWLLEQIAADEAVARAATQGTWEPDDDGCCVYTPEVGILTQVAIGGGGGTGADVIHVVQNQPAHVLAVCEAHRRIVYFCDDQIRQAGVNADAEQIERSFDAGAAFVAHNALRALAAIYADRDGFREDWR